jgi:hypothetical protein|tara:strand:- start:678 stop:890 length:213 start_codon:yes stop_codon:yes gene_type:complete
MTGKMQTSGGSTMDDVYAALAEGIDRHGPEASEMFLAKLALLLAEDSGDPDRALRLIDDAQRNMDGMRKP